MHVSFDVAYIGVGLLVSFCRSLFAYLLSFADLGTLQLKLSFYNVFLGLGVSVVIGLVSGIIPAALAAKMDPVVAIRIQ